MTHSRSNGPGAGRASEDQAADDHAARAAREAEEAQARLDQLRGEAGGALSGGEISRRRRDRTRVDDDAPPLDWRMTPRNVIIQVIVIALFIGAVWFLADVVIDGVTALFS